MLMGLIEPRHLFIKIYFKDERLWMILGEDLRKSPLLKLTLGYEEVNFKEDVRY